MTRRFTNLSFALMLASAAASAFDAEPLLPSHAHPGPIEIDDEAFAPSIRLAVTPDPASGWNVIADVRNFRFAPAAASRRHRPGEGHAHLYIDGLKVARVYTPAFHLPHLTPGRHAVTFSLNGNDHAPYARRGRPIEDTVEIVVPDPPCGAPAAPDSHTGHDHQHVAPAAPRRDPRATTPQLRLQVERDGQSGWNVLAVVRGFRFAPESASLAAKPGEGHAHLWVDGEKVARVYGPAFHLPVLAPLTHVVTYSLHANDHAPIGVEASVEVRVE